jgi:hypothetical protein
VTSGCRGVEKRRIVPAVEAMRNARKTVDGGSLGVGGLVARAMTFAGGEAVTFAMRKRWVSPSAGDEDCHEQAMGIAGGKRRKSPSKRKAEHCYM